MVDVNDGLGKGLRIFLGHIGPENFLAYDRCPGALHHRHHFKSNRGSGRSSSVGRSGETGAQTSHELAMIYDREKRHADGPGLR